MNDLISREALKKEFEKVYPLSVNEMGGIVNKQIYDLIDNAPTVENITIFCENADEKTIEELKAEMQKAQLAIFDERPQGEWEIGYTAKQKKVAVCNLCNCISFQGKTNFCHNCGADMRKGGAE